MDILMEKAKGQERDVLLRSMEMADPTFFDETAHAAHITFQNPKGVAFDYQAELYIGKTLDDRRATSGIQAFSIPAAGSLSVDFAITMPKLVVPTDTYHVYCVVATGGIPIVTYVSTEDVIVNVGPAVDITNITWD